MPLFHRKTAAPDAHIAPANPEVTLVGTNGGRLPDQQVPARLLVGAVSGPGQPSAGEAALVSGLLLGHHGRNLNVAPRAPLPRHPVIRG